MENNVRSEWLEFFLRLKQDVPGCLTLGFLSLLATAGAVGVVTDERVLLQLELMAKIFVFLGVTTTMQMAERVLHTVIK